MMMRLAYVPLSSDLRVYKNVILILKVERWTSIKEKEKLSPFHRNELSSSIAIWSWSMHFVSVPCPWFDRWLRVSQ